MKCPRCQAENPPGTRFCGQCAAPLASVCPSCGASNPPENKFCGQCAAPLGKSAQTRFAAPESYTPKHLAERILTSKTALEGERKQVTVLFADLKGSMELLADRDPEDARKILDPVLEHMMEAVHRYEGTVNQVMGDGIMALFGAPIAHEDHAVRACYAALRMLEAINRYAVEIQRAHGVPVMIRVGVNSGEVVVRAIGSDLRLDYTAVGQTTHLAARMEQTARPGSALVTADTLRLVEGYIDVKPLGPVNVKGLSTPIEVYEITGAGPGRTRLQASAMRGLTRFVGRDEEMEVLRRALVQTRNGHGQVVAVVGEPGVGKSRLFHEFIRSHRTRGSLVLESYSVSYGKATAYLPVIDLLRAYCQIDSQDDLRTIRERVAGKILMLDRALEPVIPAVLSLLDALPEADSFATLDPVLRRQRTRDGIKALLLRESRVQPLILVFEDLHWIDSETQALVDSLVESLPATGILLLVNYRPEYRHGWSSRSYYRQLRVDPLPTETATEFLDSLLGDDGALGPIKLLLIERTEGNPFFLEECVRAMVESGVLAGPRGQHRLTRSPQGIHVPATVQAILAARIDRLDVDNKRLLQTASVIGTEVQFSLLAAVADMQSDALRRGLAELQASEFLYETSLFPEPEYAFKHALTHEVAYESMLGDPRRAIHAKIIETIEARHPDRQEEHVEQLGHHAFRAEAWAKAVGYLHQAGRRAASRSAHRAAVAAFDQALVALEHVPETRETIERGVDLRSALDFELLLLGEIKRARSVLEAAEVRARVLGDRRRLGEILDRLGDRVHTLGEYERAIEYFQPALDIATELQDLGLQVFTKFHLGLVCHALGDYRHAAALFRENVVVLESDLVHERFGRQTAPALISRCWLARSLAELGEFHEAINLAEEGLRLAASTDSPFAVAQGCLSVGTVLVRRGAFAEAVAPLERGLALCELRELYGFAGAFARTLAYAHALLGHLDDSDRVKEPAGSSDLVVAQRRPILQGEIHLLAGRTGEAARLAQEALAGSREFRRRGDEALALRLLAEVAAHRDPLDAETAEGHYRESLTLAGELGMRPLIAHGHAGLAKLYRRTGQRTEADVHFAAATSMYREMGMTYWLEKAEAEQKT
jgi:predicted ATPase/class 3 adenylate cyclase